MNKKEGKVENPDPGDAAIHVQNLKEAHFFLLRPKPGNLGIV